MSDETEWVLVKRDDLLRWAEDFARDNDPGDDTDVVAPFDDYLLRPPAEAQAVAQYCEHRHKCKWHADGAWPSFGTGEGREQAWKDAHAERCGGRILPLYAHPPPSAPVGVEVVVADMRRWVRLAEASGPYAAGRTVVVQEWANQLEALVQQPEATLPDEDDSDLTVAYMAGLYDGRKESKQPAAVDDSALLDALAREYWKLDPFDMPTPGGDDADVGWRVIEYHGDEPREREVAVHYADDPRAALRAALAAQQGGES